NTTLTRRPFAPAPEPSKVVSGSLRGGPPAPDVHGGPPVFPGKVSALQAGSERPPAIRGERQRRAVPVFGIPDEDQGRRVATLDAIAVLAAVAARAPHSGRGRTTVGDHYASSLFRPAAYLAAARSMLSRGQVSKRCGVQRLHVFFRAAPRSRQRG